MLNYHFVSYCGMFSCHVYANDGFHATISFAEYACRWVTLLTNATVLIYDYIGMQNVGKHSAGTRRDTI